MKKAFDAFDPVIVRVHVDYSDNHRLLEMIKGDHINWATTSVKTTCV